MAATKTGISAATDPADRLDPALLKLAGIVLVGAVAVQLDATIVNVAIDTLGRDLHAGLSTIQWVSTGYLLALAMVIPLSGWSVDRFGSKRMWMLSLALFLGGSVLCGSAWSAGSLIAFRVVQGLGGGMLFPLLQTILVQAAGPRRLGRLTAAIAVPALLAPIVGPVIGGLILDSLSWRWIFFINVPVCAIALLLAWRGMPDPGERGEHPLDLTGLALLSPALAVIVYSFSEAGTGGGFGSVRVIVSLAIGATLLAAFAIHALRTRIEPIIDLRLFRSRSFTASAGLMFLAGLSMFGAMLLLPLYYQQVRGQGALDAGLLLAPQGLGMMIALPVVGTLTDRIGPRPIVLAGMTLATLGTLPYTQVGADTSELALGASLVLRGAGLGALFVPAMTAAYRGLRNEAIPRATSAVRIFQQVGASFGTAVLAVILQHQAAGHAGAGATGLATAFGHTFWWAVGLTAFSFVPALLLPRGRPEQAPTPPGGLTGLSSAAAGVSPMSNEPGLIARVARWCVEHRRRALIAWLVLVVAALAVSSAVGTRPANEFSLKGTESQRAVDLLKRDFPAQSGDIDQVVFQARQGRITDPAIRARIAPVLARIARLPHVTGVTSPYATRGQAISSDGRTAFATVTFDKQAPSLSKPTVNRVISAAGQARAPDLRVELGGAAIEQAQTVSFGAASAVGLAAAIVVLLIAFGSFLAMGLPVVTALLGLGTGFGAIALASQVIDMPDFSSQLAAMIGLGVGIDYSLFVVTRFRQNHRGGDGVRAATVVAMDTAGRAVLFAGSTVIIALLGMFVLGVSFLDGLAVASAIAVLFTMLAALTALPALLSRIGERIGSSRRRPAPPDTGEGGSGPGFWARWARFIRRHPWPSAVAGLAIMLAFAIPALSMRMDLSDAGNDPAGTTTRKAYDLLAEGFGRGFNGPLQIVAQLPHPDDRAALGSVAAALRGTPGVASVSPPRVSAGGGTAVYEAFPRSAPQAAATGDLVRTLRDTVLPPVARSSDTAVLVAGPTAGSIDFTHVLSGKLPLFIAVVVGLAALLLLLVFRSLVIPLQAAVMNLLSIGAALGVTVAVFQYGWLDGLVGVDKGPIESWVPVMLFAIVFGLSMDYEVFLVSRIHEEWTRRRDASDAVVEGLATTGRVITAAATIMICVFLAFVLLPERQVKMFGLSLASAVFLDAFVIRSLLLPAVLELLGRATWWFPQRLGRRLPRLATEPGPRSAAEPTEAA